MLTALPFRCSDLAYPGLPASQRRQLDAAYVLAWAWPALSYALLLVLRMGIGGIAFKLVPLLLAYRLCRQLTSAHPHLRVARDTQHTLAMQLTVAASLEGMALALVAVFGPEEAVLQTCLVLMAVCWAVHVVVGAQLVHGNRRPP